jgi:hypothetical protein
MKPKHTQSGAIVVELALFLIPLLLLAFGITEFGRAVYQYNTIAKAVRNSARHLSQYAPGDGYRITEAKNLIVCGKLTSCSAEAPLVPGMSVSLVKVLDRASDPALFNLQATGRGTLNLVGVEVDGFQFQSAMPFFVPNITFHPIRATMVQVL